MWKESRWLIIRLPLFRNFQCSQIQCIFTYTELSSRRVLTALKINRAQIGQNKKCNLPKIKHYAKGNQFELFAGSSNLDNNRSSHIPPWQKAGGGFLGCFCVTRFYRKKLLETNLKKNCQFYWKKRQTNKSTIFMVYDNILLSTVEMTSKYIMVKLCDEILRQQVVHGSTWVSNILTSFLW